MANAREVQELASALEIGVAQARRLLEQAGNAEGAADLYFEQQRNAGPGPSNQSGPARLQAAIQEMGLASITQQQALKLLRDGGNSVEGALELFLENPSAAGPRGAASPAAQANEEPVVLVSSSEESSPLNSDASDDTSSDSDDGAGGMGPTAQFTAGDLAQLFRRAVPVGANPSNSSSSSSSDSDDNNSDSSDSDDSSSDDDDPVQFASEEELWAASAAAYDDKFKQQGMHCTQSFDTACYY
jgi:hypothetical protein